MSTHDGDERESAQCTGRTLAEPSDRKIEMVDKNKRRKRLQNKRRSRTRVNIGSAFQRWRELQEWEGLRLDAEVALFLLDR
uniref:Uncharacterized protein n=1 Tax=Sinocyclocheilus grahami TaxID=75366 RepID=A0A672MYI9_SINGR